MIRYRHFQEGDDEQLADLFNRAFQMNGGGFIRTPRTWNWRYVQSPDFQPEMCQIAEDIEKRKIVGAIYVNLIEKIPINGKQYLCGDINDVSCHPDYIGKGIAKKLMEMALDYMKKRDCDISMLTADFHGFPRKRIYLKLGYEDVDRGYIFFQITHPLRLTKDLLGVAPLFPVLLILSYMPRLINRIRFKFNSFLKSFSWKIAHDDNFDEYTGSANRIMPKNFTGFPRYTKDKIDWIFRNPPLKGNQQTCITIKKDNVIIGGARISYQNVYAFKYGIKVRVGCIHEIFLDEDAFPNKRTLHLGYIYLIDKILKATTQRKIGGLFFQAHSLSLNLHLGLKGMNFFKFKGGVVMIKAVKDGIDVPHCSIPLFTPTYVSLGVP